MAAVGMFANVNIAAGLTVFFTTLVGGALFFFTLFSFNATVISGGFVVTALVALVVFGLMYRHTARLAPKDRRPAATAAVVSASHVLLFVTNLIAVVSGPPAIIGALFDPSISEQVPVSAGAIVASIVASSVVGLGLLVEKGKR
jgi:hypothetical protein